MKVGWRIAAPLVKYKQGENSQMKKPTDVTRGEKKNASKRHFKLRGAAACNFILR